MNLTTNYTSLERYNILYRANEDTFKTLIPTVSFCWVLVILGVAGNALSIHIFVTRMPKNLQNELFILLSVFNLLACGVCLPLDILDMRNMYLYPSIVLCKIARFLNMFTMASSTLTLCVLAIFRLRAANSRAVVSPHRRVRFAGLGILILLSGSVSWLAAVVFGIRSSPTFTEDITGRDCSIADVTSRTAWPVVFNVVLAVGFSCLLAVTTTAYYRIWRVVKKSRIAVTAYTMTVGVSLGSNGQRKPDLSCNENVTVPSEDIKGIKTDLSSRTDKNVNICSDDNELKTIMSPQEVNNATNKISGGQEKHKQSTKPTTALILADICTDTAPVNVSVRDDNSEDIFTPVKDNILLITDIVNIALINADGIVNNELLYTDGMTKKLLLNTNGTGKNKVLNITKKSLLNACDTANNALVNNDVVNNGPLNTDSTARGILNIDDITKYSQLSADDTANDTRLNTGSNTKHAVLNKGVESITTDSTADIHTRDGLSFFTRGNLRFTSKFVRVMSSFVCRDMGGHQIKSRMVINSKTKQHYRDNPDFSVSGYLWKNTCNPNSSTFLCDTAMTSNTKSHKANADKHHNTFINSITKDIFSIDLKTTSSAGKAALKKPGKAGHELKRKLSKTSLEATVTRTAFLLTFTFIVSYLPFFFVSIPRAINVNFDYSQNYLMMNLVNTVLRLYFIMPVVSPAIFWASNLDFRRKCKVLCAKNNFVVN
ncbi:unnamed protein product [Candidula unifasciata]|uniref:G-protein coupled receptors family 1 profile domain-containing protein n=1 Tax=Candidula unifasciata TaxID=100452 RepID=A0A8S3Z0E7_9EUPU|nr:unnamed protein product [Candidula unifasciata]